MARRSIPRRTIATAPRWGTALRFVGVGTADGGGIELPEGIAFKIPAGVTLYTQSHYLNVSNEPIRAQDVLNLELIPEGDITSLAGAYTEVDLTLDIPARAKDFPRTIDCAAPVEMTVPFIIPHMHEFGKHMTVEIERGNGDKVMVYDNDWDAALRDDFPVRYFDEHITLGPTDRVRSTCIWNNTEDFPLIFPREMCASFMVFYPSTDGTLLACDETGRNFVP